MARSRYLNQAFRLSTADNTTVQVVPNTDVTVYEAGTLTPIVQTMYAGRTGGTTRTNPFQSDANGNILFYLDSPQAVKLSAVGVDVGPLVADYEPVMPNPEDILTNNVVSSSTTDPTLTLRNSDTTNSRSFTIRNAEDTADLLLVRRVSGNDVIGLGYDPTPLPSSSQFVAYKLVDDGSYVQFALTMDCDGDGDSGTFKATARQMTTGDTALRAGEFQVLRGRGTGATQWAWGIEIGSHFQVYSSNPDTNVGVYSYNNWAGWFDSIARVTVTNGGSGYSNSFAVSFTGGGGSGGAGTATAVAGVVQSVAITSGGTGYTTPPTPVFTAGGGSSAAGTAEITVPGSTNFLSTGNNGWDSAFRAHDTDLTTLLFRVAGRTITSSNDLKGDVMSAARIYSTGLGGTRVGILDHNTAPSGETWAGLNYSNAQSGLFIGAVTAGTGYRAVHLAPFGGQVGIGVSTAAAMVGVLGLQVAGTIGAADGSAASPAYTFRSSGRQDNGMFLIASSDGVGISAAGTEVARFLGGQVLAVNGSAGAPAYSFATSGDEDGGMFRPAADAVGISAAGTEVIRFAASLVDFRPAAANPALGGGASATLGTIGGSGPATATQHSWLKIRLQGTNAYIPVWL